MKSLNAEANRLEVTEANASKFHDVKTLMSFSYDSDNLAMNSLKRRVVKEGRLQLSSFVPRYSRVNKMLPQVRRPDKRKATSNAGHSKLFENLKSTRTEDLLHTNGKGTMSSMRQYRDNNAIVRELTPEVRILNLSDIHWCPVSTLPLVGLRCPNLRKVSFRNLKQLNDAGIVALGEGCPRLLEIDLSGCVEISSTSLIKSVPKWRQMETIKLHRCNQLFDRDSGYGSQSSRLAWKSLLKAAEMAFYSSIIHYEPVKTIYFVIMAKVTKQSGAFDISILDHLQVVKEFCLKRVDHKKIKDKRKKNKSSSTKGNAKFNFLLHLLDMIQADEDHEIPLDDLFKNFAKTPIEMDEYEKRFVIRGFMKELELDKMPRFGELTRGLLRLLGNEEFGLFLEGVIRRYQEEYFSKKEGKVEEAEKCHGIDVEAPEQNLNHIKQEYMAYEQKAQKYSDLGSVLLETISSQLPSLAELDVSYCESLSADQLSSWSPCCVPIESKGNYSEVWHEYNSWVRTGEWVITKEQLEQTTALGAAEEKYIIDKQEIQDRIANYTHKSSLFHMEIHDLKAKPGADGREGMTPQETKQLQTLNRKLDIAEKRVAKTQKELEDLEVAINKVRLEAQETLANLAEGVRKKAPQPRCDLMYVNFSGCSGITDVALSWFAALCPHLKAIKFMTCDQLDFTSASIEALARACGDLTSIDLSGCPQLNKEATRALVTWCVDSLKHVSLSSCSGINSTDVLHFIEKCVGLEHLELDGHSINAASIATALKQKNLKSGSVNSCPNVSLELVKQWRDSFPDKSIRYTEWAKKPKGPTKSNKGAIKTKTSQKKKKK